MLIIILHTFVTLNNNDLRIVDNYNALTRAHRVNVIITDAANPQIRYLLGSQYVHRSAVEC